MTFTYTLSPATDLTRVRYHIQDTVEATAIFSDEEINFVLDEEDSYQAAVISCINAIIARLSGEPDMQADWLKIDWRRSSEAWMKLLAEKKSQFGLGARANSGGQHAWRPDSFQTEEPDWEAEFADLADDED